MAFRGATIAALALVLFPGCASSERRLNAELEQALFETFRDGRVQRLEPFLLTRVDDHVFSFPFSFLAFLGDSGGYSSSDVESPEEKVQSLQVQEFMRAVVVEASVQDVRAFAEAAGFNWTDARLLTGELRGALDEMAMEGGDFQAIPDAIVSMTAEGKTLSVYFIVCPTSDGRRLQGWRFFGKPMIPVLLRPSEVREIGKWRSLAGRDVDKDLAMGRLMLRGRCTVGSIEKGTYKRVRWDLRQEARALTLPAFWDPEAPDGMVHQSDGTKTGLEETGKDTLVFEGKEGEKPISVRLLPEESPHLDRPTWSAEINGQTQQFQRVPAAIRTFRSPEIAVTSLADPERGDEHTVEIIYEDGIAARVRVGDQIVERDGTIHPAEGNNEDSKEKRPPAE